MANPPVDSLKPDVSPTADPSLPLTHDDELLTPFLAAEKPAQRLGSEMEKFGVLADGTPIDYDGPAGVLRFFEALQRAGWAPEGEFEGGPTLALLKDGASITLEPGSQFELSGAQQETVHQIRSEIDAHMADLAALSKTLGVRWLGLGFQPFAKRADYKFVPKQRYAIMREYLPTRGSLALDMMLRTATVQVNFDYASEKDAMKKLRVGQALAPLTTALFANSPFYEGVPFGGKTFRGNVWLDMDPDRSGLIPRLFADDASYRDYVEWALDCPMFLIKRGDTVLANAGQTFRDFWKNGFEGHHATQGDWQLHLNTMFPEVRLKRTLEVRGADSQNAENAPALAALFTGLFYDETALEAAFQLTASYGFDEVQACRVRVPMEALAAPLRGEPLTKLGERIVEIAEAGLERRAFRNAQGADERVHLAGLKQRLSHGRTPADDLLDRAKAGDFSRAAIIEASQIPL